MPVLFLYIFYLTILKTYAKLHEAVVIYIFPRHFCQKKNQL